MALIFYVLWFLSKVINKVLLSSFLQRTREFYSKWTMILPSPVPIDFFLWCRFSANSFCQLHLSCFCAWKRLTFQVITLLAMDHLQQQCSSHSTGMYFVCFDCYNCLFDWVNLRFFVFYSFLGLLHQTPKTKLSSHSSTISHLFKFFHSILPFNVWHQNRSLIFGLFKPFRTSRARFDLTKIF